MNAEMQVTQRIPNRKKAFFLFAMEDTLPTLMRQASIGDPLFAERLAEGQADAGDELMHPANDADASRTRTFR